MYPTTYRNPEQMIIRFRKHKNVSEIFYNTMGDYALDNLHAFIKIPNWEDYNDLENTVMSLGYV